MARATRLREVLGLVAQLLPGCRVWVEKHRLLEDTEYLSVAVSCGPGRELRLREFLAGGRLVRYAYQVLVEGRPVLRYDNAPHHPEVETHPHHRHVGGRVEPLEEPSLEAFLEEARRLLGMG